MSIEFNDKADLTVVRLDGKVVGHIMKLAFNKGWFYSPKHASKEFNGPVMKTREAVKRSLGRGAA